MVPHTRRRFLHVAAAAAGGLAGCNSLTGEASHSSQTATPAARSDRRGNDRVTDPPTLLVRADTTWPPVRLDEPGRETPETPERAHISGRITNAVVGSASRADRLAVTDGVTVSDEDGTGGDRDAAAAVAAFVDETDFDSEAIYLQSTRVRECFRLKLCHVAWQSDSIDTDYTQRLRPYDERCEADAHVFESRLIRIPAALDEESVSSYSSSIGGSGRCDPSGRARAEMASGSGDATPTPEQTATENQTSGDRATGNGTAGGEQ